MTLIILGSIVHCIEFGSVSITENGCLIIEREFNTILYNLDLSKPEDFTFFESFTGITKDNLSSFNLIPATTPTNNYEIHDYRGKIILPGFVDAHIHAPQHVFSGTGMDLELLDWLQTYTFPTESKFSDINFARSNYEEVVKRTLKSGTTFASYFATIHKDSSVELAKICQRLGQRAYIGKISMDNNIHEYKEELVEGLKEEENFIVDVLKMSPEGEIFLSEIKKIGTFDEIVSDNHLQNQVSEINLLNKKNSPLILPVLTPRFAVACSSELMRGLEKFFKYYSLPLQSHLSENLGEIKLMKELFPNHESYTQVYEDHGLLNTRTYMAHCCHCTKPERNILHKASTGIVHCPNSNYMMLAGFCDVRQYVKEGIKVSLGTDVAGGYANSMLDAIRHTIMGSRQLTIMKSRERTLKNYYKQKKGENEEEDEEDPLASLDTYKLDDSKPINNWEALYLATMGGAKTLGMDNILGNFLPGKKFDGLVIDVASSDSPIDSNGILKSVQTKLEKFLFLGDDRNIIKVYVDGKLVISK